MWTVFDDIVWRWNVSLSGTRTGATTISLPGKTNLPGEASAQIRGSTSRASVKDTAQAKFFSVFSAVIFEWLPARPHPVLDFREIGPKCAGHEPSGLFVAALADLSASSFLQDRRRSTILFHSCFRKCRYL
jgi:hypothetical protein